MEVRNGFKGLDLIDRVPDELWNEVRDIVHETGIKTIVHQALCLSDLVPEIYFSLPLYNHKEFDIGHT